MTQLSKTMVAALVAVTLVSGISLVCFVHQSVKKLCAACRMSPLVIYPVCPLQSIRGVQRLETDVTASQDRC